MLDHRSCVAGADYSLSVVAHGQRHGAKLNGQTDLTALMLPVLRHINSYCRFTEFLDFEYREQGVRSFCIHPGNIPTGERPQALLAGRTVKHGSSWWHVRIERLRPLWQIHQHSVQAFAQQYFAKAACSQLTHVCMSNADPAHYCKPNLRSPDASKCAAGWLQGRCSHTGRLHLIWL